MYLQTRLEGNKSNVCLRTSLSYGLTLIVHLLDGHFMLLKKNLPAFSLIRDFGEQNTRGKCFENFRQSCVLSTDRIEIHQSQPLVWPSDLLYVMLAGCDWWISIRSVDNKEDWRKFWKRFRGCFVFPKSRINENGGNRWNIKPTRNRNPLFENCQREWIRFCMENNKQSPAS